MSITTIIGLGNPGPRFTLTRHNIGFLFVDYLADQHHGNWKKSSGCFTCTLYIGQKKVMLVKPETFMNNTGDIWPWLSKQGARSNTLLVVHDELEKKFGKIQLRNGGSARGHNGLRSLIARLGSDFWRLRIGIDRPEKKEDVANYVLEPFTKDEMSELDAVLHKAYESFLTLIEDDSPNTTP